MPSCNDAMRPYTAIGNCACCAVGGLAGQSAQTILSKVYGELGMPVPDGTSEAKDGSLAFALYGAKFALKQENPAAFVQGNQSEWLELQIDGILQFLKRRAIAAEVVGSVEKPLKVEAAMKLADGWPENSLFLCLTGYKMLAKLDYGAHWTLGQIQGGKPVFYDYQLKVTNPLVLQALKQHKNYKGFPWGDTAVSDLPPAPFGQSLAAAATSNPMLDKDDARVVILLVRKGG